MNILFLAIGIIIAIIFNFLSKPIISWIKNFHKKRKKVTVIDFSSIETEIKNIYIEIDKLRKDISSIEDLNKETIKQNSVLFPNNFVQENNKTVFVKDGKESIHETIDWRNR